MKRLTELWKCLALELGQQLDVDVMRDIKTVTHRAEHEGDAFFLVTLPNFCGAFEASLEVGKIEPTLFPGFGKNGRAPAFLRGFLALVFNTESGLLLDTPLAEGVAAVRQLTVFAKKTEMELKPSTISRAYAAYHRCEAELALFEDTASLLDPRWIRLREIFRTAFGDALSRVADDIETYGLSPQHGSGSTSDRKPGNQKWVFPYWPARWEKDNTFPFLEYASSRYGLTQTVKLRSPGDELPVKVILVPKTYTSPRLIAEEPTSMMYMQQGLHKSLVPHLEKDGLVGQLVGFTDQIPNRKMAERGSRQSDLATLDLSEASDRVSNLLVQFLFSVEPSVSEALQLLRSSHASVDGSVVALRKYASMGSALCFPVEVMVFLSIVLLGIEEATGKPCTARELIKLKGKVRVYGDDIIVPVHTVPSVVSCLEAFGLKVNKGKSFSRGKFRESCGGDYYAGEWVTPVRIRHRLPTRTDEVKELVAWTSTMNQFFFAGLWRTSEWIRESLEGVLGPLPVLPTSSQALGLHSFMPATSGTRMSPSLHCPQVKAWVVHAPISENKIEEYEALSKVFRGDFYESRNRDHLVTSGRPYGAKLVRKWVDVDELRMSAS